MSKFSGVSDPAADGKRSRLGRALTVIGAGLLALFIVPLTGGIWSVLVIINLTTSPVIPWAVAVMALVLGLMWYYLGGKGWPHSTAEARRYYLRANPVSGKVWGWALLASGLSIVALAGFWIVLFQLVKIPSNPLPDFSKYPWLTVALTLMMASLVAGVAEEATFRGYFQVALERELNAPIAIVIQCLIIALPHGLTQGFLWPTLLFYFFVDLTFGVTAYLTNSILPGVVVHALGILAFFTLIWPQDATRPLVTAGGADIWFWIHVAQVIVCTTLALLAFKQLAQATESARLGSVVQEN